MAPRRDRLLPTKGRQTDPLQKAKAKAKAETSLRRSARLTRKSALPSAEQKQPNKVTDPNPSQPIRKRKRKAAAIPTVEAQWDRRADELESQRLQASYEEMIARNAGRKTGPEDEVSKRRSINTSARNYRKGDLEQVVLLHAEPPGDVEATIKGIVNAKAPDRRAKLQEMAQEMHKHFRTEIRNAGNKRAFLRPLEVALGSLRRDNLRILYDELWIQALKPVAQSPIKGNLAVNVPTPPANDSQDLSTETPRSDDNSPVRTPRPSISMGIPTEALIYALSLQGLDMGDATDFIDSLETEMWQHEPDRPLGTVLPFLPTGIASDFTFPFSVIEGKSYSTGRQIFEAENRAAGAMACALNLLVHLDRRANGYSQPRVLFSFTTQGPIIELWAHWTDVKYGKRTFESKLWDSWNALVPVQGCWC